MPARFSPRGSEREIETGTVFMPKFDEHGLIACIVSDADDGAILMFAYMNEDALARTVETREGWFWSRSRGRLWRKGESSGNILKVADILVDCDQDAILLKVKVAGAGVTCHTGARSCFYRRLPAQPSAPHEVTLTPIGK